MPVRRSARDRSTIGEVARIEGRIEGRKTDTIQFYEGFRVSPSRRSRHALSSHSSVTARAKSWIFTGSGATRFRKELHKVVTSLPQVDGSPLITLHRSLISTRFSSVKEAAKAPISASSTPITADVSISPNGLPG